MKNGFESDYDSFLVAKIAWYYYMESMTQKRISELLGISRMRVIRLLEKARTTNTVQITIRQGSQDRIKLERALAEAHQLKDVFIVPNNPEKDANLNQSIAKAAAMYIGDRIGDHSLINIGYGETISYLINDLAAYTENPLTMISLTGGVNHYLSNLQGGLQQTKLFLLPAPLMASSPEMAKAFREEKSVLDILRMASLATMTVVGIGSIDKSATVFSTEIIDKNDYMMLQVQGAVGDILSHFYDQDGNLLETYIDERLISLPLDQLKKLPNVIGVAGGSQKVTAIHAVLKKHYLDILITDEATAAALVELNQK